MHLRALIAAFLIALSLTQFARAADESGDWPNVFNDKGGMRYSTLTQINAGNVGTLKVAWTYHTGDAGNGTTIECTPLIIDGVMYVTTVLSKAVALNAATGEELWKFDPYAGLAKLPPRASGGVNRGLAYWSDGAPDGQRRIFLGLTDARLISLDAKTGLPDPAFGANGQLDLRAALDPAIAAKSYGATSAPLVYRDLVFIGVTNDESTPAAPGDTRAFDVRTGKEVWRFHAIPRDSEFAADTWEPGAWKNRGGANAWGGLTLDAASGVLFCGTGSATSDFYGADRKGDNLFSNCTLAFDALTGKRLWHFQSVHHDLWDHDNPCPPVVVSVQHDGKTVDAVAQVTKTGYCFLLDRATGKPLFDVKELPAAYSDLSGEQASATQPVPVKPPAFARQEITEDDVTDISPEAHASALKALQSIRHERWAPPSERGTLVVPGYHGGATWAGASFDPTTGILYVNSNNVPALAGLKKGANGNYYFTGYTRFYDGVPGPNGEKYPGIKPPWGLLTAIDLSKGEFAWQIVFGEFPELKKRGVPQTGTENFGGTIVTAGGLVFIGGTMDEKLHAFDKTNGKLLWDYKLDAGGYATPSTYSVKGKQYVVIAAGGGGKLMTKSGDGFVVFTLP